MSELGTEIELDFQPDGKPGVGVLRVLCGDEPLAAERIDLLDREQREALATRQCKALRGIDGEWFRQTLLRLASKIATVTTPHKETSIPAPPQWRPFPVDSLPTILRGFVETGSTSMDCDPTMIALPALACLAGAIGMTREIHLKGLWYEPPIIWAVIVARSGTLKSPAMDFAMRAIRKAQEHQVREFDIVKGEFERIQARYEAELADWKRKPPKGAERGEIPMKPVEPQCTRYLVSDCTVESLVPILAANPRGVLLCRDELAGWMQSFNQYKGGKGGDLQNWLEMHRGGGVIVDRKTQGTIRVPRAAVSICGTVQPGTLSRLLTTEYFEAGLSARLLMAAPTPKQKQWMDITIDRGILDAFEGIIGQLLELKHAPNGDSVALEMMPDARDEFVGFYDDFAKQQYEAEDDAQAAAYAKLEGCAARLALVFALIDDPHAESVGGDSMRSGIAVGRWFAHESKRVYGLLREKGEEGEERKLLDWIRARGGTTTVRELQRNLRQYGKHDDALAALEGLVQANLARWESTGGGKPGVPSKCVRLSKQGADADITSVGAIKNEGIVGVGAVGAPRDENESGLPVSDSKREWGEL